MPIDYIIYITYLFAEKEKKECGVIGILVLLGTFVYKYGVYHLPYIHFISLTPLTAIHSFSLEGQGYHLNEYPL